MTYRAHSCRPLLAPLLLASALAACAAPAAPAPSPPPVPTKLTAAYGAVSATQIPIWVTKEQGYFTKYGLDIELSYIDGSAGVRALASGDAPVSSVGGSPCTTWATPRLCAT